jgi:cytochrome b561
MTLDLLERYLQAVKPLLPRKAQEDILRELSENIRCQMEEKEAELGRPLTDAEQEELIKQHGHPVVVAARYRRPQYLIGPGVFPFYWLTLRIAAAGALIVRFVVEIVMALVSPDPPHAILPALLTVPSVLVPVFFWITAAFAAFEICSSFMSMSWKTSWSPRSLPVTGTPAGTVARTESVALIIFGAAAIVWWQAVPAAPFLVLGPAAGIIALGPVWTTLHWPILLLTAAAVAQACVDLARPQLTPSRVKIRLAMQAVGLGILCLVLRAGTWIVVALGVQDPARYISVVRILNQTLFYCFLLGLIVEGVRFIWNCLQQFRAVPSFTTMNQPPFFHRYGSQQSKNSR